MTEVPGQEARGGEHVDWTQAQPGQPLPEFSPELYAPDATQLVPVLGPSMTEPQDPGTLIPEDEWNVTYGDGAGQGGQ